MEENIIYQIGETILLELDGVENVTYPIGILNPNSLNIIMNEGSQYEVSIILLKKL